MAIYLSSDWHIFTCQFGRKPAANIDLIDSLIAEIREKLSAVDTLYVLGDLMDDTVNLSGSLRDEWYRLVDAIIVSRARLVLIRGNNDIQSDDWYIINGFRKVSFAEWVTNSRGERILLSHTSVKVPMNHTDVFNIHGHIHRAGTDPDVITYYHRCDNNINLCTVDHREHRLTNLDDINIQEEVKRNNLYVIGNEKPGMSQFIQNQATRIMEGGIYDIY